MNESQAREAARREYMSKFTWHDDAVIAAYVEENWRRIKFEHPPKRGEFHIFKPGDAVPEWLAKFSRGAAGSFHTDCVLLHEDDGFRILKLNPNDEKPYIIMVSNVDVAFARQTMFVGPVQPIETYIATIGGISIGHR